MSRRPLVLLALTVASAIGALAVWLAAFSASGRRLDSAALDTFTVAARPPLQPSITGVAQLAGLWPLVVAGVALIAVALLRGRWLMAAAVPAILLAANLCTQLLKPALAHPRIVELSGIARTEYPASWPSGHATVAMSLALCAVLVAGPRLRPLAALGGAGYAVAVGYSLIGAGWHLPSDVIGGFLIAASFALLGAAVLSWLEAPRAAPAPRTSRATASGSAPPAAPARPAIGALALGALVAAATAALCGVVLLARHPGASAFAVEHPSAVVAAAGVGLLGLALTGALTLALRR